MLSCGVNGVDSGVIACFIFIGVCAIRAVNGVKKGVENTRSSNAKLITLCLKICGSLGINDRCESVNSLLEQYGVPGPRYSRYAISKSIIASRPELPGGAGAVAPSIKAGLGWVPLGIKL